VKKEKMNTKTKRGKAIIGIALASIMLASVFAAMVPTASAVSTGTKFNYIGANLTGQTVLVGQNVKFNTTEGNNWAGTVTVQKLDEGTWYSYRGPWTDNEAYNVGWDTEITLRATNSAGQNTTLSVQDPDIPLILKVGTKTVSSLTVGTNLTLDTGGINLFPQDKVDLIVIGPDGRIKTDPINNQEFSNITVANLIAWYGAGNLETEGWGLGDYTFQIKTKSEYACGLEDDSAVKDLTIAKGEIDIEAEMTTVTELEAVKLTVTGVANDIIHVNATPSSNHVLFAGGVEDTPSAADEKDNFGHTIDEDGKRTYSVSFNDTGSYTITVTVKGGVRDGEDATVDITVTEKGVTFDMSTTLVIGEKVTVKGTSNTGDWVQIAVDDYLCSELKKLVLEDGEFEKEIDTSTACGQRLAVPGSVRMKAFIDTSYLEDVDLGDKTDDGSLALLMTRGDLVAELSSKSVAQDDDFTISGTAKGSKDVNILIVAPKGSSGSVISGATADGMRNLRCSGCTPESTNIYHTTTTVSTTDDTFSKKINVGENVDTGSYLVILVTPGADGKYGKSGESELVSATEYETAFAPYYFAAKTQEDVMAIIEDAISLSDDLVWVGYIKVEAAYVALDTIADVGIGEPLAVTGTTNREEGFTIVVTAKGPKELTPATVLVKNGTFNATFDTTDAPTGMYTVEADDGDGHTDEATVSIVTAVPTPVVSPTPTPVVSATPPPVATPTPTPEETPTPTPEPPGFEAVFAIAGLLAVAYLVLRRRK
jgi:PGF-CTERM protein